MSFHIPSNRMFMCEVPSLKDKELCDALKAMDAAEEKEVRLENKLTQFANKLNVDNHRTQNNDNDNDLDPTVLAIGTMATGFVASAITNSLGLDGLSEALVTGGIASAIIAGVGLTYKFYKVPVAGCKSEAKEERSSEGFQWSRERLQRMEDKVTTLNELARQEGLEENIKNQIFSARDFFEMRLQLQTEVLPQEFKEPANAE